MLKFSTIKRWAPISLIIALLICFYLLDLGQYLSFTSLKQHRHALIAWTSEHYILAVMGYMCIYAIAIAISIPGAAFFTLVGGFLFGILPGSIYVIISATIGATLVFWAVRYPLADLVRHNASSWINKMRQGFKQNAFSYLLFLRLVPIFPFWAVNIVPALFGVTTAEYVAATFLGIIPGSVVYVMLGNGLGHIFDQDQIPDLTIIFEPAVLLPLLALGLLSLLPTLIKQLRGGNANK